MLAPTTNGLEASCCAGAYGLPLLKATPGYRVQEDADYRYSFEHPRGWVRKCNRHLCQPAHRSESALAYTPLLKTFVSRWSGKTGSEREFMLVIFRCLPSLMSVVCLLVAIASNHPT